MPALRLIHGAAFDPETTHLMALAYEKAVASSDDIELRELIAKRIIEAARRGERAVDKLAAYGREGPPGIIEAAG
jgi:hypothetical protein